MTNLVGLRAFHHEANVSRNRIPLFLVAPVMIRDGNSAICTGQSIKFDGLSRKRCPSGYRTRRSTRCGVVPTGNSDKLVVEARTIAWARVVVCGLGLCPFAQEALDSNSVRVTISDCENETQVRRDFYSEVGTLVESSPHEVSTTLLVMPEFAATDFLRFHRLCEKLEHDIEEDDALVDEVMIACFHPQHQWGDSEYVDDAINFDKRAPYPVINLLRAPQVDRQVEEGKTQHILERNQLKLESMGSAELKSLYRLL